MNIQPHQIIGALAALGVYPPGGSSGVVVRRAVLANDITGLSGGSAPVAITWDTGDFDPLNPTRIYVPPGFSHALITGMARVTGTGVTEMWAQYNGDTARRLGFNLSGGSPTTRVSACAQTWPVSGGDYFELVVARATTLTDIHSDNSYTSISLTLFP